MAREALIAFSVHEISINNLPADCNVCAVHWGMCSTLGDIMSTLGDIMSTLGVSTQIQLFSQ